MGVTIDYEDTLADGATASFQAALLYTSSRGKQLAAVYGALFCAHCTGDRRIRVHTLCLPVTSRIAQIHAAVDTYAVVSMLAKLAADRAMDAAKRVPLTDVREAIVNACIDALASFAHNSALGTGFGSDVLVAPPQLLRLLPLYALALVKCVSHKCLISVYVRAFAVRTVDGREHSIGHARLRTTRPTHVACRPTDAVRLSGLVRVAHTTDDRRG